MSEKVGLDDYLLSHTAEDFEALPEHELKAGEDIKIKTTKNGNKSTKKRNNLQSAKLLIDDYKIIQSKKEGKFFCYKDGYYQEVSENELNALMYSEYGDLPLSNIAAIFKAIKAHTEKPLHLFNRSRYLNLANGIYDLETYELREHTPDIYNTIRLNVNHDQDARCPKWIDAVAEIIDDEENISALQEFFGLCLTTDTYDKALILTGEGSNGKSTLLDVLSGILGTESVSQIPMMLLEDRNFVAQLHGKLLNIASEIGSKSTVCDEVLKQIITHDEITGAHKYGHPFTFRPSCKLIFATNNLPRTDDKTKALYRRLMIMNLTKEFTEETGKHKYHRELLEEKDGIFNWMIEGLKRLRERKRFAIGKKMVSAVEEYKKENNPVISFIEDECVVESCAEAGKKEFYDAYKEYCKEYGFYALNIKKFGKEVQRCLKEQIFGDRNSARTMRIWRGIRLLMRGENKDPERPF